MKKTLIALTLVAAASAVYASADVSFKSGGTSVTGANVANASTDGAITPSSEVTEATITPSSTTLPTSGINVTIAMTAMFNDPAEITTNLTEDTSAQGGIVLASSGWQCWNNDGWVAITNANVGIAAGTYNLVAELNYTAAEPSVSYAVNSNAMATADGETDSFPLKGSSLTKLNYLGLLGSGSVSALEITYWTTNVNVSTDETTGDKTITVTANTTADLSDALTADTTYTIVNTTSKTLSWTDSDNKYAVRSGDQLTVKSGTPANDLPSYDSYALGLDAETATSKPLLTSAQNKSTSDLTFSVANIGTKDEIANRAEVTCTLEELDAPDGTGTTKATFTAGESTNVTLPDTVKFYKLSIKVKAK